MDDSLSSKLGMYSHRKQAELPGATPANLLPKVRHGVVNKGPNLTVAEVTWTMGRVGARISAPAAGDAA